MTEFVLPRTAGNTRRILYMIPGPMDRTELGRGEVERRLEILNGWAAPLGAAVDIWTAGSGPKSIESQTEAFLSVPESIRMSIDANDDGRWGSIIVGCFGAPGVGALRELSTIPVVSPLAASVGLAHQLGSELGLISTDEARIPSHREEVRALGVGSRLAATTALNIPILAFRERLPQVEHETKAAVMRLLDRGADTVILGCMSLAFTNISAELSETLGVPIINPVQAAVGTAATLAAMNATSSRITYSTPPKMRDGSSLASILVAAAG